MKQHEITIAQLEGDIRFLKGELNREPTEAELSQYPTRKELWMWDHQRKLHDVQGRLYALTNQEETP